MLKLKKVKPLLNHVITTANVYKETITDDGLLVDDSKEQGEFKEYQTVIACGPNVTTVKPGDLVVINPKAYAMPVHKPVEDKITGLMTGDEVEMVIRFPIIDINGVPHLFLYDRDVEFIVEDYEEVDDTTISEDKAYVI